MNVFLSLGIAVAAAAIVLPSAAWCWYQWSHRRLIAAASALPSTLPTFPLLGHLHYLVKLSLGSRSLLLDLIRHPTFFTTTLWIGPVPHIFISRPEDILKVLSSSNTLQNSSEYDLFDFALGKGLLTAPVHIWKRTRKEITPLFHLRNLQNLVPVINGTGRELVRNLSQHVGQGHVDLLPLIYPLTLYNTFIVMFGADTCVDFRSEKFKQTVEYVDCIGGITASRIFFLWLRLDSVFRFVYRKYLRTAEKAWQATGRTILLKKLAEKKMWIQPDDKGDKFYNTFRHYHSENDTEATTFADVFLKLREVDPIFDESYMRGETHTFMLAGSESTALTISACLVALGTHLDVQEKLYKDISKVVGEDCQDITIEDINKMTYLDQVLKETLRRFVLVPHIGRKSTGDTHLHDCTIPAGSNIYIALAALQFNPDIFPEPEKFDPDRFSPDNVAKNDKYSFLPFSKGPRDCIGKQYAMIQMKITLAHILREYKVYSDMNIHEMRYEYGIVLRSKEGYLIKLEKRQRVI